MVKILAGWGKREDNRDHSRQSSNFESIWALSFRSVDLQWLIGRNEYTESKGAVLYSAVQLCFPSLSSRLLSSTLLLHHSKFSITPTSSRHRKTNLHFCYRSTLSSSAQFCDSLSHLATLPCVVLKPRYVPRARLLAQFHTYAQSIIHAHLSSHPLFPVASTQDALHQFSSRLSTGTKLFVVADWCVKSFDSQDIPHCTTDAHFTSLSSSFRFTHDCRQRWQATRTRLKLLSLPRVRLPTWLLLVALSRVILRCVCFLSMFLHWSDSRLFVFRFCGLF